MASVTGFDINKAPQLTMHVVIHGYRVWQWRVSLASWLVRVANWVAPVNVSIEQQVKTHG